MHSNLDGDNWFGHKITYPSCMPFNWVHTRQSLVRRHVFPVVGISPLSFSLLPTSSSPVGAVGFISLGSPPFVLGIWYLVLAGPAGQATEKSYVRSRMPYCSCRTHLLGLISTIQITPIPHLSLDLPIMSLKRCNTPRVGTAGTSATGAFSRTSSSESSS